MELQTNRIINGDCVEEMGNLPESSIDLIVTSPPYNVGIDYDVHNDTQSMDNYWRFTDDWLSQAFRILKDDGRTFHTKSTFRTEVDVFYLWLSFGL